MNTTIYIALLVHGLAPCPKYSATYSTFLFLVLRLLTSANRHLHFQSEIFNLLNIDSFLIKTSKIKNKD